MRANWKGLWCSTRLHGAEGHRIQKDKGKTATSVSKREGAA